MAQQEIEGHQVQVKVSWHMSLVRHYDIACTMFPAWAIEDEP